MHVCAESLQVEKVCSGFGGGGVGENGGRSDEDHTHTHTHTHTHKQGSRHCYQIVRLWAPSYTFSCCSPLPVLELVKISKPP